jgi:hypothetical protein
MDHGIRGKNGTCFIEIAGVEGLIEMADESFALFS